MKILKVNTYNVIPGPFGKTFVLDKATSTKGKITKDVFVKTSSKEDKPVSGSELLVGSYEDDNNISISLKKNDLNNTFITDFSAAKITDGKGRCDYKIFNNKYECKKDISLLWDYPNGNFKLLGTYDDARVMKDALDDFQEVIYSDKYCDDFGKNPYINFQINRANKYLSTIA